LLHRIENADSFKQFWRFLEVQFFLSVVSDALSTGERVPLDFLAKESILSNLISGIICRVTQIKIKSRKNSKASFLIAHT